MNNPITLWHGLPLKTHCKCDVQSSGRTILSNFGMGAEPLLPEVKAQDGNSIGNSILKKRKKESKSLLINIELPIELPPLCLASARRCLWSGLGTAMPGVSPARVWPWPRPMLGSSLVRIGLGSGQGLRTRLMPSVVPARLGQAQPRNVFWFGRQEFAAHRKLLFVSSSCHSNHKDRRFLGDHPWDLKTGNTEGNTIINAMKDIIFKASTRGKKNMSTLPRRAFFENKRGCCVCH